MFPDSLANQFNRIGIRLQQLQAQAASGQRIRLPEDDPSAMRRVLDLQAEARTIGQYQENIARLQERSTATYDVMQAVKRISDRAGEIATMADDTRSPQELRIFAAEVTQLIEQAAQLMNSKHQGDHLFGGTITDQPPFVVSKNATGQVTGVAYQGNQVVPEVEIAEGVTLTVNVPGVNPTGTGAQGFVSDSRTGADFFAHLISLQDNLLAGDTAAINGVDLPTLQNDEQQIISQMATTGAMQARMEAALSVAATRDASIENLISTQADADLADVVVRLNQTQVAYQAALQSGARMLNLSLLDYLR
jgi:flagellar hook-associated protein 3 FlgL